MILCTFTRPAKLLLVGLTEDNITQLKKDKVLAVISPKEVIDDVVRFMAGSWNFPPNWSGEILIAWDASPDEFRQLLRENPRSFVFITCEEIVTHARLELSASPPWKAGMPSLGLIVARDELALAKRFGAYREKAKSVHMADKTAHPN